MLKSLIKIANDLDGTGLTKEADYLDVIIVKEAVTAGLMGAVSNFLSGGTAESEGEMSGAPILVNEDMPPPETIPLDMSNISDTLMGADLDLMTLEDEGRKEELEKNLDKLLDEAEELEEYCEEGDEEACQDADEVLEELEKNYPSYDPRMDSATLVSKSLSNSPGHRDTAYYRYVDPETGEVEYFTVDIEDEK